VSGDLENGYGDSPEDAAQTITLAAAAGLVGGSIEDSRNKDGDSKNKSEDSKDKNEDPTHRRDDSIDDPIYEIAAAAERVRAAADAAHALAFPFTLTARAENYLNGRTDLADTIKRLQAYQEAGADVLYAPGLTRKEEIETVVRSVDRSVNVLAGLGDPPLDFAALSAMGVRRISVGSALSRAALGAFLRAAHEMRDDGKFNFTKDAAGSRELNQIFSGSAERD
jgi:2-methylisocitrate lyase-like PEP mutase family enzyme